MHKNRLSSDHSKKQFSAWLPEEILVIFNKCTRLQQVWYNKDAYYPS
jgi:hypothetical protein